MANLTIGRLRGVDGNTVPSAGRMPPGHNRKLEQPALERAIEERCLPRDLQVNELGQPQVAGKKIRSPARKALLQRIAQQRIEARKLLLIREPDAVGRIAEKNAMVGRRGAGPSGLATR